MRELRIECRESTHSRTCGASQPLIALASQLGSRIEAAFPGRPGEAAVELTLRVDAGWEHHRTFFFDGLALLSAGLFPLVPQWGSARVSSRLALTRPSPGAKPESVEDKRLADIDLDIRVPYTGYWYSWFHARPATRAFDDAWKMAADQIVDRLRVHVASGFSTVVRAPVERWEGHYLGGGEDDEVRGETAVRVVNGTLREESSLVLDRGDQWRIITRARQPRTPRGLLAKYLTALSGLEAGYFMGKAWVSSEAQDSFGGRYTVASGQASSSGYRIGAYNIPARSDWFLFPTLGFFSLDIDIHDFREDIPLVSVPGAAEIPGAGSDPSTGRPIDLGDPNVYRLELRSGYLGQRISGTLVFGTPQVHLFGTLEGGLNILEVRHTRVYLGNYTSAGYSAAWVRSAALRGILGLAIRPWHLALRCEVNYEGYFKFSFPEPIEFMGRVELNPQKNKYERRRTQVEAASSGTLNVFFGANLYY